MNDSNQNPDLIFFHKIVLLLLTQITYRQEILRVSLKIIPNAVSVLHLNIRSLSKNFESFKELYLLSFKFNIVCFSETLSKEEKVNENSLYQLKGYNLLHQNRKHKNGGGVKQLRFSQLGHEAITRTGITCNKIYCYMRDSAYW